MTDRNARASGHQKGKLLGGGVIVILIALYGVLKPALEQHFDFDLPDQPARVTSVNDNTNSVDQSADVERNGSSEQSAQLRDVGGKVLVSTAGLRYVPGSREGHRLDHVLRHDNDIPDRPGKHGVFDGDRDDLLRVVDEAWLLVKAGDDAVETHNEDGRTIHDVDMGRRVGFVGGQVGNERNKPAAVHIRLIVDGDKLISAYPY